MESENNWNVKWPIYKWPLELQIEMPNIRLYMYYNQKLLNVLIIPVSGEKRITIFWISQNKDQKCC